MMRFSGFPSILERLILRIGDNLDYNKDITEIALTYLGKQTVSFLDEQHVLFDVDVQTKIVFIIFLSIVFILKIDWKV